MRKVIKRLVAEFFVILMLVSLFPFQVFAVDPVSAATMANAMAQALTAYGASHGVSMMFDVSDTSGIGEGLHDLWGQFKADINDNNVPTYDSLAVTLWTNLYTKVRNSVAVNVSAENVGYFDQFWNWLLSGPAEMQRVDNQYYEWNVVNGSVSPIRVYVELNPVGPLPLLSSPAATESGYLSTKPVNYSTVGFPSYYAVYQYAGSSSVYVFHVGSDLYCVTNESGAKVRYFRKFYYDDAWNYQNQTQDYALNGSSSGLYFSKRQFNDDVWYAPGFASETDGLTYINSIFNGQVVVSDSEISVAPYIGDTVPQNVPIPDTDDPDYTPLPFVGPLGVPWIDNNFGDGETMTDAQREAIAGSLDDVIEDDGTLTLEEDQTVPDNPGGEVIGGPSAYTVPGLADVFPFCIPFDIYHFLQALAADPTPPHFTAQFAFPQAVGGTMRIDLDFDTPTFNQIAAILRTMELLAFCVGLALLTRSMFIRG